MTVVVLSVLNSTIASAEDRVRHHAHAGSFVGTTKNLFHEVFSDGECKMWFPLAAIFKQMRALKWRGFRAPHGYLKSLEVPL